MITAIVISFLAGSAVSGYLCYKYGRSVEAKAQAVLAAVKK